MWLRSAQPTPSGLGNLDVGARQWRLILPKATHIEGRTAWKASLNDYHRESSIDWGTTARVIRFPISDFVGGSVSLSIGGSILMSAEGQNRITTDSAFSEKCGAPHFTLSDEAESTVSDGLPASASRSL